MLVVTGWTISSAVFEPVAHLYPPRVRTIAYDHRGSGRSAPWLGPVSMAMLAADAARVLDDRGLDRAHVVGLSMGAMVALELALRMPSRVKSLVLVGGTPGGPLSRVPGARAVARTVRRAGAAACAAARGPRRCCSPPRSAREHPDRVAELVKPFQRHRPPPWTVQFQTVAASCFSRRGDLHRVRAPALVVHGDHDAMSPLANAQALATASRARSCASRAAATPPARAAEAAAERCSTGSSGTPAPPPRAGAARRVAERLTRPFALHAGAARSPRSSCPPFVVACARKVRARMAASEIFRDGLLDGQVAIVSGGRVGARARHRAWSWPALGARVIISRHRLEPLQETATLAERVEPVGLRHPQEDPGRSAWCGRRGPGFQGHVDLLVDDTRRCRA